MNHRTLTSSRSSLWHANLPLANDDLKPTFR